MKISILFFSILLILASCTQENGVQQLFKDRPQMRVEKDSRLYREAESVMQMMSWRGRDPQEPYSSQITLDGEILLNRELNFAESWICFFYESRNFRRRDRFEFLWKEGFRGNLSRTEWVRKNAELELKAGKDFLILLDTLLVPEFEKRGIPPESVEVKKYRELFSQEIEDWMASPPHAYPWSFWGTYYDEHFTKKQQ